MYNLSEKDMIDRIKQCNENKIAECFKKWENAIDINTSETIPEGKYFVNIEKVKKRLAGAGEQRASSVVSGDVKPLVPLIGTLPLAGILL